MSKVDVWLQVGDTQIPYHDPRAIELFMKVAKALKPVAIDFVGDIDDQPEYSSFTEGTTAEFFNIIKKEKKLKIELPDGTVQDESDEDFRNRVSPLPLIKEHANGAREFYEAVRKQHPHADLHASLGNHDIRVFKYVDKKAPEFIEEVTPELLWGLDSLGITWEMYSAPPKMRFADFYVHHGVTVSSSGMAVSGDIDKYNISLIRGHDHRGGVVHKTFPMVNKMLTGMGTGHLSNPAMLDYTINPAWEQGFGLVYLFDGQAFPQFISIKDYTAVVDGKVFKA